LSGIQQVSTLKEWEEHYLDHIATGPYRNPECRVRNPLESSNDLLPLRLSPSPEKNNPQPPLLCKFNSLLGKINLSFSMRRAVQKYFEYLANTPQ
jgi:hypothetical protein